MRYRGVRTRVVRRETRVWEVMQEGADHERSQQFPDRAIQIFQPEELPVTQRGHDPTFDDLYTDFDLGLVPRTIHRTRR